MKTIDSLGINIPLEVRIKVALQLYFIDKHNGSFFISHDKDGKEIHDPNNIKAMKEAKPIIDIVLKEIEEFNK